MGGWVVISGELADMESRLRRFRSIFEVANMPPLTVNCAVRLPRFVSCSWAWNSSGVPDVDIAEDESHVLILHGAVTDLGRNGRIARTRADTASHILEHLRQEGEDCIKELNGSFSCVIHCKRSGESEAYTDRFASRPVCYANEGEAVLLGTFPSALAAFRKDSVKLNPAALWSLFHYSRHVGPNTMYSGIYSLLAGEKLCSAGDGAPRRVQWFNRRFVPELGLGAREWAERVAEALKESARRCLHTCTRSYIFLSGGLDSRIAAASLGRCVEAISLCTKPNTETRIAALVARSVGMKYTRVIRSPYWYLDTLTAAALISSGNHFTHNAHFIIPARDLAQEHGDVQFYLGDMLENFNKHYFSYRPQCPPGFRVDALADFLHQCAPYVLKDISRVGLYSRENAEQIPGGNGRVWPPCSGRVAA
jgi:hypothetical protein